MNKIIECVPNFSEGRDLQKIDQIISPFRGKQGVKIGRASCRERV